MQKSFLFFVFFSLATVSAVAKSKYKCHNHSFLQAPIELVRDQGHWWLGKEAEHWCPLEIVEESLTESNYQGWMLLAPKQSSCSVATKMNPPAERALLELRLSAKFLDQNKGFIRISVDNSEAEFGTDTVKTFLNCRPTLDSL